MASEGKEHIVEVGDMHRHARILNRRIRAGSVVEPVENGLHRLNAAIGGHPQRERLVIARARSCANTQRTGRQTETALVGELQAHMSARNAAFQVVWRALGYQFALVEDGDAVGPLVGSSRKMRRGLPTSVIARSSRRRMPPEY